MKIIFDAPACKKDVKCIKASPNFCCMDSDLIDKNSVYTVAFSFETEGHLYYYLDGWYKMPFLSDCFNPIKL